uniref:Kelch domain-containing protein 10 n=1 Tax=Strongyloides papillosus TaxID=174720 RepID=A0A0N5CD48_STREA
MYWTVHIDGGPKRVNHAAVAVNGLIYSFGGYSSGEHYDKNESIDIHALCSETFRWEKIKNREYNISDVLLTNNQRTSRYEYDSNIFNNYPVPYQRYGHTVVVWNDKIYLWGGRNDDHGASDLLHSYDPANNTWEIVNAHGRIPPARDGHTAVVWKNKMFIFGGFEEDHQIFSQDVFVFDFITNEWAEVKPTGKKPAWRDFHTACVIDGKMYIFGGRCDEMGMFISNKDIYTNEVYVLDLEEYSWKTITKKGDGPSGRRSHSSWVFNNRMYIFGGYYGPTNSHFDDLYEFDPKTELWRKINVIGNGPSARRRQCSVVYNNKVFIFGGTMPNLSWKAAHINSTLTDLSDLHVLDFQPLLKTIALQSLIKNDLNDIYIECLPLQLRNEMTLMLMPNLISGNTRKQAKG